jgi:hypothetical protein
MARKSSDIVQPNLRIREDLRRRLLQAAKKRDVSLNREMTDRLVASFDRDALADLSKVAADFENAFSRYGREQEHRARQQELVAAVEALIERLPAGIAEAYPDEYAGLQEAIAAIVNEFGRGHQED